MVENQRRSGDDADGAVHEVDRELAYHLERRASELGRAGLDREEALLQARREFGDLEGARAYCSRMARRTARRQRRGRLFADLCADARFAARALRGNPGFALPAIFIMALGIGATTAMFSIVDAVLLTPLDFPESQQLLQVWESDGRGRTATDPISPYALAEWRARATTLASIAGYGYEAVALSGDERPVRLVAVEASASFFATLGVQAALGRTFEPHEEGLAHRVAILSHRAWVGRFSSEPSILGRSVVLNGLPYVIVGVMPEAFAFPASAELWIPFTFDPRTLSPGSHFLFGIARRQPGVDLAEARREMEAIGLQLDSETGDGHFARLVPLHESVVGASAAGLWMAFTAVALVLAVGCANVANLLLVRAGGRASEIAVRAALGAGRARLARQLLVEGMVLAAGACAVGLLAAAFGLDVLVAHLPVGVPRAAEIDLDPAMLGFALLAAIVTGAVFGVAPLAFVVRVHGLATSGDGGSRNTPSRGTRWLGSALVATEVCFTLVLLTTAGLLMGSFARLRDVDPGFRGEDVLTVRISLPADGYSAPAAKTAFVSALVEEIGQLTGIESVATVDSLPFSGSRSSSSFEIEGAFDDPETPRSADRREVTPGYFETMGIPLLRGRRVERHDTAESLPVVVVNQAFARRFFPDRDPTGHRLRLGTGEEVALYGEPVWREIVGVVGDIIHDNLTVSPAPEMYLPFPQHPSTRVAVAMRALGDPTGIINQVRDAVLRVDPEQPIYDVARMDERLDRFLAPARTNAWALGSLSATALLLAVFGIYSVVSNLVARQKRELGIRLALGAPGTAVVKLLLGQSMVPIALGIAIGTAASLLAGRSLQALLFGVDPADPLALAVPAAAVAATGLLACLLPARRALTVDPVLSLRQP